MQNASYVLTSLYGKCHYLHSEAERAVCPRLLYDFMKYTRFMIEIKEIMIACLSDMSFRHYTNSPSQAYHNDVVYIRVYTLVPGHMDNYFILVIGMYRGPFLYSGYLLQRHNCIVKIL